MGLTLLLAGLLAFTAAVFSSAEEIQFVPDRLTVLDRTSGLVWIKDGNLAGKRLSWQGANDFIKELNKKGYAGKKDWRLPGKAELETLVNYAKAAGYTEIADALNKIGFKDVLPDCYLSSELDKSRPGHAWVVDMYDGSVLSDNANTANCYVLPVRFKKQI